MDSCQDKDTPKHGQDNLSTAHAKNSVTREGTHQSGGQPVYRAPLIPVKTDKLKNRLSKRESVFFKPTDKDNKVLEELVLKVLPEKDRYKINIIPCNSGGLGKKTMARAKSVDDMDVALIADPVVPEEEDIPAVSRDSKKDILKAAKGGVDPLNLIANRARSVERKGKKTRSYIDIKIGADSFVSERAGKFSDYYRIISRIGEGGYGQVFKVQHKKSGLIRAMKSSLFSLTQ